jgi:hypothetical protein
MNAKFAERQPQVLRLRPLRRTSLRMTDQLFKMTVQLFKMTVQSFNLTGQSFRAFQIQDNRLC